MRNRLGLVAPERRRALARDWIDRLQIRAASVDAPAQTLSGGNQQRVVLAKWLATTPKVLILDGPTVGVDIRNKAGIHEMIRALADDGMAILLISDEVPEVYFNCDRVLHMRDGRIAGEFVPGAVSEHALAEALYALAFGVVSGDRDGACGGNRRHRASILVARLALLPDRCRTS